MSAKKIEISRVEHAQTAPSAPASTLVDRVGKPRRELADRLEVDLEGEEDVVVRVVQRIRNVGAWGDRSILFALLDDLRVDGPVPVGWILVRVAESVPVVDEKGAGVFAEEVVEVHDLVQQYAYYAAHVASGCLWRVAEARAGYFGQVGVLVASLGVGAEDDGAEDHGCAVGGEESPWKVLGQVAGERLAIVDHAAVEWTSGVLGRPVVVECLQRVEARATDAVLECGDVLTWRGEETSEDTPY